MKVRFHRLIWILLLLGVVSCSKNFTSEIIYIKITEIPTELSPKTVQHMIKKVLLNLTTQPLHSQNCSLLDELYYEDGFLYLVLKKGIRFHNGYPLTTEHLLYYLAKIEIDNYEIINDFKIKIKHKENNKNKIDRLFAERIRFYPESDTDRVQNYFVGTGEFYLNNYSDTQFKLKTFNSHPVFSKSINRTLIISQENHIDADVIIPFEKIDKVTCQNILRSKI